MQQRPSGVRSRWASASALAVLTLTATGIGVAPAQSAADASCPAPYPVGQLSKGQTVSGLTVDGVSSGTTPDSFSGTVIGVLKDGIAPGMDMIMVRLSSPEIDRVGGIWEGMSGSPVYAADGRLIGAVAYGLSSGPTPVAGVTPAADMESMLDQAPADTPAPAARVALPHRMARMVASSARVTRRQLSGGMTQLRLPFGVSGLSGTKRLQQARMLLGLKGVRLMQAGAVGADTPATPLVPGGNLAASVSYGDVTTAGVGTVTAVCGPEVLAFGHPMNDTGPATLTLHGADALYVQEDPSAPFKVANISAPVGTIDQDRLEGLHGTVGATPKTARITSYVASDGRSRTGTTWISVPDQVPDIATMHLLADQDRVFDGVGKGSGTVSWRIRGQRQDGSHFYLSRTDMYADSSDLSSAVAFSLDDTLSRLQNNSAQHITIDKVTTHSVLTRAFSHYRIGAVQVRWAGQWMPASPNAVMPARAGRRLRLRVLLTSPTLGSRWVPVAVSVPRHAAGKVGTLQVAGGNNGGAGGLGGLGGGVGPIGGPGMRTAPSFSTVLRRLRHTPHHNDVVAELSLFRRGGGNVKRSGTGTADHVVDGSLSFQIQGIG